MSVSFNRWTYIVLTLISIGCAKVDQLAQSSLKTTELQFVTTSLPSAAAGQSYSMQVFVKGGTPDYTFELISGSMPPGLSMSTDAGAITGLIGSTASGTYSFTIQVKDKKDKTITGAYNIKISTLVTINTTALPAAQINTAYTQTIAASGGSGTYTFTSTGLPTGLTLNQNTGVITGTPTVGGSNSVDIKVVDSDAMQSQKNFTLYVTTPLSVPAMPTKFAPVGRAYSNTLTISGGQTPYTVSVTTGSLPTGLSMSSAGVITGTPDKGANVKNSPMSFGVTVTDAAAQTATRSYLIIVSIPVQILNDVDAPLRVAGSGVPYSEPLRVMGGVGALTYSATGLPAGLSIGATSGIISGTTAAVGTASVSFTVTDANAVATTLSKNVKVVAAGLATFDMTMPVMSAMQGDAGAGSYNGVWPSSSYIAMEDMVTGDGGKPELVMPMVTGTTNGRRVLISSQKADVGQNYGMFLTSSYHGDKVNSPLTTTYPPLIFDYDLDGDLDLITNDQTNSAAGGMRIMLGDNTWTTNTSRVEVVHGSAGDLYQMAYGNINCANITGGCATGLNQDAYPDVVAASSATGYIRVFANCNNATPNNPWWAGTNPACTNTTAPAAAAPAGMKAYNAGTLTWAAPITIGLPRAITLADMNGDNKLDLVVGNTVGSMFIVKGNGDGSFDTTVSGVKYIASSPLVTTLNAVYVADFDGDGAKDAVFSSANGAGSGNLTGIVIAWGACTGTCTVASPGTGTGDWSAVSQYPIGDLATYTTAPPVVKIDDVNGDGKMDIAFSLIGGSSIRSNLLLYINQGSRNFVRHGLTPGGNGVYSIAFADVTSTNGTTRKDMILNISNGNWGRIVVFPNNGANGPAMPYNFPNYFRVNPPDSDGAVYGTPSVADLNNDGYPDMIVKTGATASVLLGSAGGNLTAQNSQISTGDTSPIGPYVVALTTAGGSTVNWQLGNQTALADFNGDGVWDFVSANWNMGNMGQVQIAIGNGDGTFVGGQTLPANLSCITSNFGARTVDTADFDRDGKTDIVVGTGCAGGSAQAYVFKGYGDGTFNSTPMTVITGASTHIDSLLARDFDGDGKQDIALGCWDGTVKFMWGDGNGAFTSNGATTQATGLTGGLFKMIAGDFDANGKIDVAVTAGTTSSFALVLISSQSSSQVRTNTGMSGSYATPPSVALTAGDFNQDGKLDIAVSKAIAGGLQYFMGSNDGFFTTPTVVYHPLLGSAPTGLWGNSVHAFDMDLDGKTDVISGSPEAYSLMVYPNRSQ